MSISTLLKLIILVGTLNRWIFIDNSCVCIVQTTVLAFSISSNLNTTLYSVYYV